MKNFRIRTTLNVHPRHCCYENYATITKGATGLIRYDLSTSRYIVDFDEDGNLDFQQFTIVFKQPNGALEEYDYYKDDGTIDTAHFKYDDLLNVILFTFSPQETSQLQAADTDSPMEWEVTIVTKDGYTLIEKQDPILVFDSFFNNRGSEYDPHSWYVSERILCSSTLICSD